MLHSAFRRPAEPRVWPIFGLILWFASCTSTAIRFELPLAHPANPEAKEAAFRRPPPIFDRLADESPAEKPSAMGQHGSHSAMKHEDEAVVGLSPLYACPMHPEERSAVPGACPVCDMGLEPLHVDGEEPVAKLEQPDKGPYLDEEDP